MEKNNKKLLLNNTLIKKVEELRNQVYKFQFINGKYK